MFGGKKKDNELDDNDLFMFTRYKPLALDNLCKATHFNKKEIRLMYQGFKQECPTGVCSEEDFKCIFCQVFSAGRYSNKTQLSSQRGTANVFTTHKVIYAFLDATKYAHLVFNTFKSMGCQDSGFLNFEQFINMLSSLSRGSLMEKLRWIFGLYDINGDGFISKSEMLIIVSAIYDMLGEYAVPIVDAAAAKEHVDKLFHLIDADKDGVISFDEFADWCQKDEGRAQALLMFDTIF